MLIQSIEINNFRSLRSIDLDCRTSSGPDDRALIALLGRNGGGKSSLLYALDAFYDVAAKVTVDDCYGRDSTNEIVIRVTYGDLRETEQTEFSSYIANDQLIVTKRIQVNDKGCTQKYFAAARQIAEFAECRRLGNKNDLKRRYAELASLEMFNGLHPTAKTADIAEGHMSQFEAEHPEMLVTVEREEQFFGPKEVGGGKLDKFTKFVLVPAVRSAAAEEHKKGAINELIDMIVLRQVNLRTDVRELRAEMKDKIEKIFCQENLTELGGLGSSISTLLAQYAPGCALQLTWGDPVVPDIPLPKAIADLVEDDFPCPITHTGHGLQRSLILTLLQFLATTELPREEPESHDDEGDVNLDRQSQSEVILNPDLILAIEEPELYLHPSRCRHLSELLLKLTHKPKDVTAARNQILYATHSPYFVDLHRFDQVRIARKPKVSGLPVPCCIMTQYSLDEAAKALAKIAGREPADFTRDSFRARSLPVMTIAVNEGFFANVVVVVEGLSDVGVLWTVQERLGQEWAARGIAVVPAMGKENVDRPVVVFRGLKIPTYFVFDGDARYRGKGNDQEKQTVARNVRYQRMAGVSPVDFPSTQAFELWAVLERDIEHELQAAAGDDYGRIARSACDELRYDGTSELMKNTEGAARLVDEIYEAGHTIPIAEEIVRHVSALCSPIPVLEPTDTSG